MMGNKEKANVTYGAYTKEESDRLNALWSDPVYIRNKYKFLDGQCNAPTEKYRWWDLLILCLSYQQISWLAFLFSIPISCLIIWGLMLLFNLF